MKIDRKLVLSKCDGACAYCGQELTGKFQIDHVIPQSLFYSCIKNKWDVPDFLSHLTENDLNHIHNLMPTCGSCNNYKSSFTLDKFEKELNLIVGRLNKTSSIFRIAKRFGLVVEQYSEVRFWFRLHMEALATEKDKNVLLYTTQEFADSIAYPTYKTNPFINNPNFFGVN